MHIAEPTQRARKIGAALKRYAEVVRTPAGRRMIADNMESSIRRSKMGGAMLDKVQVMYAYFRDPEEPWGKKAMIGAALLYLVVPSDLIPDWFAVVGFADDFAAISFVYASMRDVLTHYEERRQGREAPLA